jgi:hypothetical protein
MLTPAIVANLHAPQLTKGFFTQKGGHSEVHGIYDAGQPIHLYASEKLAGIWNEIGG